MPQLGLFEGAHLPRTAARDALARGDLELARTKLAGLAEATEEAADAARLARIASELRAPADDPVAAAHAAFASALDAGQPRGFLSDAEWFQLYAQRIAGALAAEPARPFRGWLAAHFALASGDAEAAWRAAERIVEILAPGPAWIEAARLAFALVRDSSARGWVHAACLDSPCELAPDPPALERCGIRALDAAPPPPPLPAPVEALFETVQGLDDLPAPRTRWVAVISEIDRVLAPEGPSVDEPAAGERPDADAPRAFLAALRAARRSRERDGARPGDRCSDRELRARRRMQRLAPALLDRYLEGLRASLL